MTNHPNRSKRVHRPEQLLADIESRFPSAWALVERLRSLRGKDLPMWLSWCYLPISQGWSSVWRECLDRGEGGDEGEYIGDLARLAALGAWRMTKGVYAFEPALYDTLISVERLPGDIPAETFLRLPEWCIYIQTPGMMSFGDGNELHGAFVHLDWDVETHEMELRFCLDEVGRSYGIPLHLGNWSIASSLRRTYDQAIEQVRQRGDEWTEDRTETLRGALDRLCALTLYLCSEGAQIKGPGKPGNPVPKKTKDRWRLFAADGVRRWRAG